MGDLPEYMAVHARLAVDVSRTLRQGQADTVVAALEALADALPFGQLLNSDDLRQIAAAYSRKTLL